LPEQLRTLAGSGLRSPAPDNRLQACYPMGHGTNCCPHSGPWAGLNR